MKKKEEKEEKKIEKPVVKMRYISLLWKDLKVEYFHGIYLNGKLKKTKKRIH